MDLIIEYLLQKGGIFGALFAISLAWIVYREKNLLGKPDKEDDEKEEAEKNIDKIISLLDDIKTNQDAAFKKIDVFSPIIEQIHSMEKNELSKLDKIINFNSSVDPKINDIEKKTVDLWNWHSVKDSDGIPVWYVRRSLEDSLSKLKDSFEQFDKNFNHVGKEIFVDLDERLQKVNDERVSELKKLLESYNKTVTDLVLALEKIKFLLKSKEDGD
jgi:hypothetical protein